MGNSSLRKETGEVTTSRAAEKHTEEELPFRIDYTSIPSEIILHVLTFLPETPQQLNTLNKAFPSKVLGGLLCDNDDLWQTVCRNYDRKATLSEEHQSWKELAKFLYNNLSFTLPAGVVTKYNNNYFCTVLSMSFHRQKEKGSKTIMLHIDEVGDYSLGGIQSATSSKLFVNNHSYAPTEHHQEISTVTRYKGLLEYEFLGSKKLPAEITSLEFMYGLSGYDHADLLVHLKYDKKKYPWL